MANYYAIAEAGEGGSWWISFPGRDGIVSAADDARLIVSQARDALESVAMHGGRLPQSIEEGRPYTRRPIRFPGSGLRFRSAVRPANGQGRLAHLLI